MEQTLTILKPDCVEKGLVGDVIAHLTREGFEVCAMKMIRLTPEGAQGFYYVHKERPFFPDLVSYMTSGPVVPMVLRRDDAIAHLRKVMGATDPSKADDGTIRKLHAESIERNIIHGSDSPESAKYEMAYFFSALEIQ